jgi:hypothetical protein
MTQIDIEGAQTAVGIADESIEALRHAADLLQCAADLYRSSGFNGEDIQDYCNKVKEIIECDNGESGLLQMVKALYQRIGVSKN